MPWERRPNIDAVALKRKNDELASQLLRVREELRNKQTYTAGLEILLHERLGKIDELNGKIDQLREQVRKLDQENDRLVEMIRFAPQLRLGPREAKPPGFS
jgi:predicted nuclease with TOPRIM domain